MNPSEGCTQRKPIDQTPIEPEKTEVTFDWVRTGQEPICLDGRPDLIRKVLGLPEESTSSTPTQPKESFLDQTASSALLSTVDKLFKGAGKAVGAIVFGAIGAVALISLAVKRIVSGLLIGATVLPLTILGAVAGAMTALKTGSSDSIIGGLALGALTSIFLSNLIASPLQFTSSCFGKAAIAGFRNFGISEKAARFLERTKEKSDESVTGTSPRDILSTREFANAWNLFTGKESVGDVSTPHTDG